MPRIGADVQLGRRASLLCRGAQQFGVVAADRVIRPAVDEQERPLVETLDRLDGVDRRDVLAGPLPGIDSG